MGKKRLESRQQKRKETLQRKAREKKEEEKTETTKTKEKKKPKKKKKIEVKKPEVDEAKGRAEFLPISPKASAEICKAISGKGIEKAKRILKGAIDMKKPIPYKRFNKTVPHKKGKGFGPGRYPVKAAKRIKDVLENAVANAKYLEIDPEKLYVKRAIANRALSKESQRGKYTHLKIVVGKKAGMVNK